MNYGYAGHDQRIIAGAALGATNAIGAADACKREVDIPLQMVRLSSALDHAQDTVNELANRMEPLVRPSPPETAGNDKVGHAIPSTQLGGELYGYALRVSKLTDRLQDLLRRLEL
jgi:hypothetical protein